MIVKQIFLAFGDIDDLNPDQEITEAKSLERCLKKATLAWACTLIQTTAFEVLLPECGEILTALLVYME